jgi:flagellar motility protein MotE (MotC chaperone)
VKNVRILPVIIAAAGALFVMKGIGLLTEGRFVLTGSTAAVAAGGGGHGPEKPAASPSAKPHGPPPGEEAPPLAEKRPAAEPIKIEDLPPDLEVLEKLTERRQQLDKRSEELEERETLLQATEKRVEARIAELKALEAQIATKVAENDAEKARELKSLVATYESMKGRDAARILDRLDMPVLIAIAKQMKPAKMAEILAAMSPEAAQKLTIELSGASESSAAASAKSLPKIGEITEKPVSAN